MEREGKAQRESTQSEALVFLTTIKISIVCVIIDMGVSGSVQGALELLLTLNSYLISSVVQTRGNIL